MVLAMKSEVASNLSAATPAAISRGMAGMGKPICSAKITQKMTPTQMDPVQQKMFLIMPIVFTYILRDFPAGLLIYWTVQNIVGVAQQIYVNRQPD